MGLGAALAALWGIARIHRAASGKVVSVAEQTLADTGIADLEAAAGLAPALKFSATS